MTNSQSSAPSRLAVLCQVARSAQRIDQTMSVIENGARTSEYIPVCLFATTILRLLAGFLALQYQVETNNWSILLDCCSQHLRIGATSAGLRNQLVAVNTQKRVTIK